MGNTATKLHNEDFEDRATVVNFLVMRCHFTTSKEIRSVTGITPVRMRQLCQLFPQTFVSSTEGYKTCYAATSAEIKHNVQSLLRRAEKIMHRANALSNLL